MCYLDIPCLKLLEHFCFQSICFSFLEPSQVHPYHSRGSLFSFSLHAVTKPVFFIFDFLFCFLILVQSLLFIFLLKELFFFFFFSFFFFSFLAYLQLASFGAGHFFHLVISICCNFSDKIFFFFVHAKIVRSALLLMIASFFF